jgi:TMEM175 potassium channel family protein
MSRGRLEAFSDGVLAIVITIMVLELAPPHGSTIEDLVPLWPKFLSYVMSFAYIGIYWNNHHHLLQATHAVTGRVLWANLHLLFWLSLVPFATAWMGENNFAPIPTAVYGGSLIMPAIAFTFLVAAIVRVPDQNHALVEEIGRDIKGKISILGYAVAIPIALVLPLAAVAIYIAIATLWIVPDPRFERSATVEASHREGGH